MQLPDNNILDIIISMVLIYALLSILVSILVEWWHQRSKSRGKLLRRAIMQMLNDPLNLHYGELFFNHYLINGMRNEKGNRPPQYISSTVFADVLISIIAKQKDANSRKVSLTETTDSEKKYEIEEPSNDELIERFKKALDSMNPSPFSDTIRCMWEKSDNANKTEEFKKALSFWFDDYMDRVSGWFKFEQRSKLFIVSMIVAIGLNVDSVHLIKMISMDDSLRNNLVATAEQVADQYNTLSDSAKQQTAELEKVFVTLFPDSTLRKDNGYFKPIKKWVDAKVKDSTSRVYLAKADSLIKADSVTREYTQRIDRIMNISSSLNIPIGWDDSAAPISWFSKRVDIAQPLPGTKTIKHGELLAYADKRNAFSWKNLLLYFIGVAISIVSLSFGAPFWFDTLVKLVNIRRAGKKPSALNHLPKPN